MAQLFVKINLSQLLTKSFMCQKIAACSLLVWHMLKGESVRYLLLLGLLVSTLQSKNTIDPELVDIQSINPTIRVELFLAAGNTFLGKLYPSNARAYMHKNVALVLDLIQKELEPLGLGLKIKDAYRPLRVQKQLWEIVLAMNLKNPGDYISDPSVEGGRHPRGIAVDVTLVRLSDGSELVMPPFGFIEQAHQGYMGNDLTQEQINNREFLKELMTHHGFALIRCEWWHYNLPNWQDYTPLDLTFEELLS